MLQRIDLIERWGSGLKRIHEDCERNGVKVEFVRRKEGFKVIFWRPAELGTPQTTQKTMEKTMEKTMQKILAAIRGNPAITIKELAIAVDLSEIGVQYNLKKLKTAGLIRRVGPDKGGHWEIVGKE